MNLVRHGGDTELQELYRRDIWDAIREKHRLLHEEHGDIPDIENVFLNNLNEQEYAEFVKSKPAD